MNTLQGPGGVSELEDKVLGPTYDYSGHIRSPDELGMSSEGNFDALGSDISGLLGYVDLLVSGKCQLGHCASKYPVSGSTFGRPLGNKFFLDTAVQCEDKATGNQVTRSIYINNVPDGEIPFISNMGGVAFSDFEGLMPGIMSNIAQIHPMQILMAFVNGQSPTCQAVTMPTIDAATNAEGTATRYLINSDIELMPPAWFVEGVVPPKSSYDLSNDISGNGTTTATAGNGTTTATSGNGTTTATAGNGTTTATAGNGTTTQAFTSRVDAYSPKTSLNGSQNLQGSRVVQGSRIDYSKMPDNVLIKIYYSALGLLGLYILMRLMMKKKR